MKCKWYQEEAFYLGQESCENPVSELPKLEKRRTGKTYPDVPNPVSCTKCQLHSAFGFAFVVLGIGGVIFYALSKLEISE